MQKPYEDSFWVGYICGAKEIINTLHKERLPSRDASLILAWIFHFDVMSRFSFRHWRTDMITATAVELGFVAGTEECALQYTFACISFARQLPYIAEHAHPITQLLAKVLDTPLYSSYSLYHTVEYQRSLDDLSYKLENAIITSIEEDDQQQEDSRHLEVARLAGLVYHERVARNFSGQSARIDKWSAKAHSVFGKLNTFPSSFALFTFGCEAHTDEDRVRFLNFFTRLEQVPHLRRVLEVKGLIQTAWTQHDLEVHGQLEYIHMLNLVLSSRDAIPTFM